MSENFRIAVVDAENADAMAQIASMDAELRETAWSASSWSATLSGSSAALIAYLGEQPVAFACFAAVIEQGELLMVGVLPSARRRGIAHQLLVEGEAQLRWLGATTIHLEVASQNDAAIALYERLGYTKRGLRRAYYADGDDAVLMARDFAVCAG